jgi:SAM-dependent methyltransferase
MKEEQIRKRGIFNKYLELANADAERLFATKSPFIAISCPACDSACCTFEFEKKGFKYVSCKNCGTLFATPRPPSGLLKNFYSKSSSTSFYVNEFFKPVAEKRREKIFAPKAEHINGIMGSRKGELIGDIGAGFGLFLEELKKIRADNRYVAIEPSAEMADICRAKGFEVKNMCLEDISGMTEAFGFLTAFELVEHLFDPVSFFRKVYTLLKPGGYFFLTTLNGEGFDVLLLWEKSKSVTPPHHLNFFNTGSIRHLSERVGFEVAEISTPGKLDWDIVEGMIKNEGIDLGRFWDLLAKKGSEESKRGLQDWILRNRLSSHMRALLRKPI